MARERKKKEETEEEGGEFAEFLADVSEEIAQRVESLDARAKAPAEKKKKTPMTADAGLIPEWPNIADRMIEEVR
ncbi:MAG TPA: hypothetical protein VEK37_14845 [Gemmatimonadaceae bacterium]|nr:hypothetical protein [Gemmatimonadaceae bacterium]